MGIEKTADETDFATQVEEVSRQAHIDEVRRRMKPEQEPDEHGNYPHPDCVECGNELPQARLKLGRILCVECQTVKERRLALG